MVVQMRVMFYSHLHLKFKPGGKESAFKELFHWYGCLPHLHNLMAWSERFLPFRACCIHSKFKYQPDLELDWVVSFTLAGIAITEPWISVHNVIELARQGLRNYSRTQIFFIAAMLQIRLNLHFMPDRSLKVQKSLCCQRKHSHSVNPRNY